MKYASDPGTGGGAHRPTGAGGAGTHRPGSNRRH